jgi:xylose isomerase
MKPLQNSVGIWAFGPSVTRFVPPGYHPEVSNEDMVARTSRVAEGLHDLIDGLEYHYPGEINEGNADRVCEALSSFGMVVPMIASGLHPDPTYRLGSLINPDPKLRQKAIEINKRGIDLASSIGANFIIWPGSEGYNYLFQRAYADTWARFIDGVAEIAQHAQEHQVKILLEHKNSEPAMKILMRSIGMALFVIQQVQARGVTTDHVLVNMDWQHLIMNGECLGEYADLLAAHGKLGHQHGNDGWGTFDDDNVVGTNFFMQILELAVVLQDVGYGEHGEIVGFDLYPYTEDQVAAVRRSIVQWEFIWETAARIDRTELNEARSRADALAGYRAAYAALGLDAEREEEIIRRRSRRKAAETMT